MANQRSLWVEGTDDEHVLKHVCAKNQIQLDKFESLMSIDNLMSSLPVRLKATEEGDIVGVVVDANEGISSRWQAIRGLVTKAGYENVPGQPAPEGMILEPPGGTPLPRLGAWIMPDNRVNGTLEDFLRFLIPQPSLLFDHVQKSVATIPDGERRFKKSHESKAIMHTWLAWQEEPGLPFGTAIKARFLDPDVRQVNDLVSWMKKLFRLETTAALSGDESEEP